METSQILHKFSEIITQKKLKRTQVKQPAETQLLLQIMRAKQVSRRWGWGIPPCCGVSSHPLQVPSPLATGGAGDQLLLKTNPGTCVLPTSGGLFSTHPSLRPREPGRKNKEKETTLKRVVPKWFFFYFILALPSSVQILTTSVFCS